MAALVYQRGRHPITVFVSSDVRNPIARPDVQSVRGFHLHHWVNGDLSFWVVSDVNEAELSAFVRALRGS